MSVAVAAAKKCTHDTAPATCFNYAAVPATTSRNVSHAPSFQSNAPPIPFDVEKYVENPIHPSHIVLSVGLSVKFQSQPKATLNRHPMFLGVVFNHAVFPTRPCFYFSLNSTRVKQMTHHLKQNFFPFKTKLSYSNSVAWTFCLNEENYLNTKSDHVGLRCINPRISSIMLQ